MLTVDQYLNLGPGSQVRLFKEIYTVTGLSDLGTHLERVLTSDSGSVLRFGIYLVHLMAYHGHVDLTHQEDKNEAKVVQDDDYIIPYLEDIGI